MSQNDPKLTTIPVRNATDRTSRPPTQMVSRFKDRRFLAFLCLVLIVSNILTPALVAIILRRDQLVIVTSESGNMVIAPGLDFSEAEKVHKTCALLATQALLQRNPTGFDMPEMVNNLFFRDGKIKADDEIYSALPNLKKRSMHQKVEISTIKVNSVKKTANIQIYYIQVAGQIIRDGNIGGTRVREVDQFTVLYQMWQNPRLTENGRYPLVVADYKYLDLTPTGTRRKNEPGNTANSR